MHDAGIYYLAQAICSSLMPQGFPSIYSLCPDVYKCAAKAKCAAKVRALLTCMLLKYKISIFLERFSSLSAKINTFLDVSFAKNSTGQESLC